MWGLQGANKSADPHRLGDLPSDLAPFSQIITRSLKGCNANPAEKQAVV